MKLKVYRTSKDNPVERASLVNFEVVDGLPEIKFEINPEVTYQSLLGFGGALTPATQEILDMLSSKDQREVLEALYSKKGLNYSTVRLCISSSDFSLKSYDYLNGEKDLSKFSLEYEARCAKYIKKIQDIAFRDLFIFASPWSAPAFMKDNNELAHGGHLLKEYYPMWGEYFAKYIKGMSELGVDIDAVSVQNEPEAVQIWESMIYTAEEEKNFAKTALIPALKKYKLDTKIVIWDHNKDHVYERVKDVLSDDELNKCIYGVGYHWYCSNEFENLDKVHKEFPNQHLLFTEGCVEVKCSYLSNSLFDWKNGEFYGMNYIKGLIHHTEAFFDWNMLLDEKGGPNHVDNFCEAPIMFDTKENKLIYNTSYYYIKHLSHFIFRGAKRSKCIYKEHENIFAVSFINPNGDNVLVIQNQDNKSFNAAIIIGSEKFVGNLPPHSIQTLIIKK